MNVSESNILLKQYISFNKASTGYWFFLFLEKLSTTGNVETSVENDVAIGRYLMIVFYFLHVSKLI